MTTSFKAILSLVSAAVLMVLLSAVTFAQTVFWQLDVSTPTFEQQTSTFNLDYHVLSTEQTDSFKVELIANGTVIETQNPTTSKYGVNGRFVRSNVPEGTYTYTVKATRTSDNTVQQTAPKTVSVNLPDAQVVVVSTPTTTATAVSTTSGAAAVTTSANGNGTGTESPTTEQTSITQTASANTDTDVKGASTKNRNFTIAGLLLLALVGGVLWYGISNYLNKKDV